MCQRWPYFNLYSNYIPKNNQTQQEKYFIGHTDTFNTPVYLLFKKKTVKTLFQKCISEAVYKKERM